MRSPTHLGVTGALVRGTQGEEWQRFITALFSSHDSRDVLEGHAGRVLGARLCSPHLRATRGHASRAACSQWLSSLLKRLAAREQLIPRLESFLLGEQAPVPF